MAATDDRATDGAAAFEDRLEIEGLRAVAERIDALADIAELMGDDRQAGALRERSQVARLRAMRLLDD